MQLRSVQDRLWFVRDSLPTILRMRNERLRPAAAMAMLNASGQLTPAGRQWTVQDIEQVLADSRFMDRLNRRESRSARNPGPAPLPDQCDRCSEPLNYHRDDASQLPRFDDSVITDLCAACAAGPLDCPVCGEATNHLGVIADHHTWVCRDCPTTTYALACANSNLKARNNPNHADRDE